jgi:glutaconyl-CoA/methylmalonyl-CoA decarboxylase subunit gamma
MPNRQIKVIVNGKSYEVEVGDLRKSPVQVIVDGEPYDVELENQPEISAPTQAMEVKTRSAPMVVERTAQKQTHSTPVTLSPGGNGDEIKAPMPGTILDISVKVGDSVKRGDMLCALEAMKMKSAIRSPRAGVIASVEVAEGQKVVFGDLLIRLG